MEHIYKQVPAVRGPLFTNIDIVCGLNESRIFLLYITPLSLRNYTWKHHTCGDLPGGTYLSAYRVAAVYNDVSALAKTNMELGLCGCSVYSVNIGTRCVRIVYRITRILHLYPTYLMYQQL